ncbi:MAG: hypothetical protein P8017_02365, partial [Deltaproteobacteria bacterium]
NLRETGYITDEQYHEALDEPLQVKAGSDLGALAPYFIAYIRPQLEQILGENLLYRGGLTIQTTIKEGWQRVAQTELEKGLLALESRHRSQARPSGGSSRSSGEPGSSAPSDP